MNESVTIKWDDNLQKLLQRFQNAAQQSKTAIGSALYQEAEELISASKPLVPVLTGTLRASGFVQLPVYNSDGTIQVAAGYGGPAGSGNVGGDSNSEAVGYALYVHENMEAHHTTGQAKFLEQPFNERLSGMSGRLAKSLQGKLI